MFSSIHTQHALAHSKMSYYYSNPNTTSNNSAKNGVLSSGRSTIGYSASKSLAKPLPSITASTNPKLPPQAPAPISQLALDSTSNLSIKSTPANIKPALPNSVSASTSAMPAAPLLSSQINYVTYNLDDLKLNNTPGGQQQQTATSSGLAKNLSTANIYSNMNNKYPVYPQAKKSTSYNHALTEINSHFLTRKVVILDILMLII